MGKLTALALSTLASLALTSSDCSDGFTYHGCAVVDLYSLGNPLVFSDSALTPEACRKACESHSVAALFPDSCRCGDNLDAIRPVEDAVCDYACGNEMTSGMCGSTCEPDVSTVYTKLRPSPGDTSLPGGSAVPMPPQEPETGSDQQDGEPRKIPSESGPGDATNPGGSSVPGGPPSRMVPPNPKSINPNPESQPSAGQQEPPQGPGSGYSDRNGPSGSGTPGAANEPAGTAPQPLSWFPSGTSSPEPPPGSGNAAPGDDSVPVGPSSQTPNSGNMTDGPPPDSAPWPNPSGGIITTEGDPPEPSVVTGSRASELDIPVASRLGFVAIMAVILL